jgi:hypothetical protein
VTIPEPCDKLRGAVLDRTPYGPTVDAFAEAYVPEGFVSVMQNQRGCFTSGGVYDFWKMDGQDGYDTMLWIRNQSWSNGDIFTVGISADANSAYADFQIDNPYIKGGYEMWGSGFGHETAYWGGAYRYDLISHWLLTLNTCPNAPEIEKEVRQNEPYNEWWAALEANGPYGNFFPNVKAPGVTQMGWWDIFAQPQLDSWTGAITMGDPSIRDKEWLFVIPLGHCTGDETTFDFPKFEIGDPQLMSVQIFKGNFSHPVFTTCNKINFYVFGPVPALNQNKSTTVGNYWSSLPTWPKFTETRYYLNANGNLSTTQQSSSSKFVYTFDPKNPAPAIGANTLYSSTPCGPRDQSEKIETRTDVLKWTSPVFTTPMALTGKITATLNVASTAVDTDFYVSVTDVYPSPSNVSTTIRYGAIRMRWRDDPSNAKNMTPGQTYQVTIDMWSTAYIVNVGHALRVLITSSRSPEFTVNPNNGWTLYTDNGPIIVANNTVYQGASTPSYISLPVVSINDIPENPKIR